MYTASTTADSTTLATEPAASTTFTTATTVDPSTITSSRIAASSTTFTTTTITTTTTERTMSSFGRVKLRFIDPGDQNTGWRVHRRRDPYDVGWRAQCVENSRRSADFLCRSPPAPWVATVQMRIVNSTSSHPPPGITLTRDTPTD